MLPNDVTADGAVVVAPDVMNVTMYGMFESVMEVEIMCGMLSVYG